VCGIGGVYCFGKERLTENDAERIIILSILLEKRGKTAFGFYNGEKVIKFPGRASDIIEEISKITPFENLIVGKKMFLVHTRYPTSGDPLINANNHPFETKNFILAHNGYLWKYGYLNDDKYKIDKKRKIKELKKDDEDDEIDEIETDSYQIILRLEREYAKDNDPINALKRVMEEIYNDGVYALWVYAKKNDLLMLYRDFNPLYIAYDEDKLWFASENDMLKGIGLKKIESVDMGYIYAYTRDKKTPQKVKATEVRVKINTAWDKEINYKSKHKRKYDYDFDDDDWRYWNGYSWHYLP